MSVSQDKTLLCWDVARVTISRKIRAHDADVNCVRMDAESNVAVTGGADKKVHVWDLRSRSNAAMQVRARCAVRTRAWIVGLTPPPSRLSLRRRTA